MPYDGVLVDAPVDLEVEGGEPVARFINDIGVEGGGVFATGQLLLRQGDGEIFCEVLAVPLVIYHENLACEGVALLVAQLAEIV